MNSNGQPQRIQKGPVHSMNVPDEEAVLRLSRSSLRAQPPVVRFIDRPPAIDFRRGLRRPA